MWRSLCLSRRGGHVVSRRGSWVNKAANIQTFVIFLQWFFVNFQLKNVDLAPQAWCWCPSLSRPCDSKYFVFPEREGERALQCWLSSSSLREVLERKGDLEVKHLQCWFKFCHPMLCALVYQGSFSLHASLSSPWSWCMSWMMFRWW